MEPALRQYMIDEDASYSIHPSLSILSAYNPQFTPPLQHQATIAHDTTQG